MIRDLIKNESGQATTEYVIFIAMLVAVILAVGRGMAERLQALFGDRMQSYIQARYFRTENMYSFTLGIRGR